MVNDSVREELATKISPRKIENKAIPTKKPPQKTISRGKPTVPKPVNQIKLNPSPKNVTTKPSNTAEIVINQTNRTLVEFQAQKNDIPEWRLQLQNVVKHRQKTQARNSAPSFGSGLGAALALSAAPAVEADIFVGDFPAIENDDRITRALKRIEQSRNKYLIEEPVLRATPVVEVESPKGKEFPFSITGKAPFVESTPNSVRVNTESSTKPTLVPSGRETPKSLYDTSELEPQFLEAKVSTSFKRSPVEKVEEKKSEAPPVIITENKDVKMQPSVKPVEEADDVEVYDDFAPLALRFNSGLFDVIIGSFVSLILLAPFMLLGGSWFTVSGFFGFLAAFAVVMFIYLTTTIGVFGKTFGMHLFSLEMIDIGGEEYPTFHQAAVSSSVFLLSLTFGGVGFLSSFVDEESRAVHDLVSGTIIVKEF